MKGSSSLSSVADSSLTPTDPSIPAVMLGSLRAASSWRCLRCASSAFSRWFSPSRLALALIFVFNGWAAHSRRRISSFQASWSDCSRLSIWSMLALAASRVVARRAFSVRSFCTADSASTWMLAAFSLSSLAARSFSCICCSSWVLISSSRARGSPPGTSVGRGTGAVWEDWEEAEVRIMVLACFSCWISTSCCRTWLISLSFSSAMAWLFLSDSKYSGDPRTSSTSK
mmetsp:Transcript_15874/g.31714  ORF Transcript_15874/g.31714 Transcript_15874/m.31714 type:complete len:228 (-) Transcript_15874:647-1330(-)